MSSSIVSPHPEIAADASRGEEESETSDILPSELWSEIFVRLPVRSLLTLQCVSKTFLSLILNPNFTSLHFSRYNSSYSHSKPSDLFILGREFVPSFISYPLDLERYYNYYLARCSYTPAETTEFGYHVHWGSRCDVLGSVHGLFLLQRHSPSSKDMILCNPSIRKRMIIPPSPSSHLGWNKLGFGYDSVNNDYKIVSIVYVKDQPLNPESQDHVRASPCCTIIEVYTLRSLSWKTIGTDFMSSSCKFREGCVHVNGALHWIEGQDMYYFGAREFDLSPVVSFDLGTELVSYSGLPDFHVSDGTVNVGRLLLSFHGSIAVLYVTVCKVSVWVMRGSNWAEEWTVESNPMLYNFLFSEKGCITSAIFSNESNELLVAGFNGMVSYDLKTQQFRFRDPPVIYVDKFVDSLLWRSLEATEGGQE